MGEAKGKKETPSAFPPFVEIFGDDGERDGKARILRGLKESYRAFSLPLLDGDLSGFDLRVYPVIEDDSDLKLWWADRSKTAVYLAARIFRDGEFRKSLVGLLESLVEDREKKGSLRAQALKSLVELDPMTGRKVLVRLLREEPEKKILPSAAAFSKAVARAYLGAILDSLEKGGLPSGLDGFCLWVALKSCPPRERPKPERWADLLLEILMRRGTRECVLFCCPMFNALVRAGKIGIPKDPAKRAAGQVSLLREIQGLGAVGKNQAAFRLFRETRWFLAGSSAESVFWKILLENMVGSPGRDLPGEILQRAIDLLLRETPGLAGDVFLSLLHSGRVPLSGKARVLIGFLSNPKFPKVCPFAVFAAYDFCAWLKGKTDGPARKALKTILESPKIPERRKEEIILRIGSPGGR